MFGVQFLHQLLRNYICV